LLVTVKQGLLIYDATAVRCFATTINKVRVMYSRHVTQDELVTAFKAGRVRVSNVYNACVDNVYVYLTVVL